MASVNIVALVFILLIGLFSDWGDAFWFLGGYLFAFIIAGWIWRGKL